VKRRLVTLAAAPHPVHASSARDASLLVPAHLGARVMATVINAVLMYATCVGGIEWDALKAQQQTDAERGITV
jgi:hypothetical protein